MATSSFSQRLNTSAIRILLTSPQRGVVQDLLRRGLLVETQAKRNLAGVGGPKRIDSGRLRASISTHLVSRGGTPAALVGTNVNYAMFVHEGTGIYGPKHKMITPKRAKLLRFRPKNSRRFVYARRVRGMPRNRFLANALSAARG